MPELIFTPQQLSSKIINPRTNRKIKLGNVVNKYGLIYLKYINDFELDSNNNVVARPLLAVNKDDGTIIKLNFDSPTLPQPFQKLKINRIKANTTIENYDIVPSIEADRPVNLSFSVEFDWVPNDGYEPRSKQKRFTGMYTPRQLSDDNFIRDILDPFYTKVWGIDNIRYQILLSKNDKTLELTDMELREEVPLKIDNLFNEIISKDHQHCIHGYIKDCYPKYCKSDKQMSNISKINNVSDIHAWAIKRDFKMVAFDQSGNIIKSHYPKKKNKEKTMAFIAANSHLYPLKNQYINKKHGDMTRIEIVDDTEQKLAELINNGTAPKFVGMGITKLQYFTIMDDKTEVVFSSNKEYTRCLEILNMFGLGDKIHPSTTISKLGDIIEQSYSYRPTADGKTVKIMTQSFIPEMREISKSGYNYMDDNFEIDMTTETLYTIDKNKQYPYELYSLKKLPVIDMKYHIPKKIVSQEHSIHPYYMYIVTIEESTIILPQNGRYFGSTLQYAKEHGIKFKMLEELETKLEPNYMRRMVKDLYSKVKTNKITKDEFKEIMNIFIGKFECKSTELKSTKYVKTMNTEELKTFDGYKYPITEKYTLGFIESKSHTIMSRNPIADLIKDNSRISVHKMMYKLKLKSTDIKQIKTDAITFKSISTEYKHYINNEISGWKEIDFTQMSKPNIYNVDPPTFFYKTIDNDKLVTGYGGCGKSYDIMNNVIPKLDKTYIVLSPSHKALDEYRKLEFNCAVIQKYTSSNTLPDEHYIIVDEVGMIDNQMWDMLYKCKLSNKEIMSYGDFGQLLPVGCDKPFDNPNFLNMMFSKQLVNDKNYRNSFTHEYYDTLRFNATKLRNQELEKYNTKYEDAELIIAYKRTTRDDYNEKICEYLNIESLCDIGAKVICKTNALREYNIYNNMCFTVKDVEQKTITIETATTSHRIPIKKFKRKNFFDYAYALTLYAVQGSSLESFHYCKEDINFLNGRSLYTLISRLKQK